MVLGMDRYIKDFKSWNNKKELLDGQTLSADFFFLEREVWWAAVGTNIGSEIDGKNENYERPILVIKKINEELLSAIPITSTIKTGVGFYPIDRNGKRYTLLILQTRTFSAKRLLRPIFRVNESDFEEIRQEFVNFFISPQNETPVAGGISTDITGT
jgi:mRNA interferase MazF